MAPRTKAKKKTSKRSGMERDIAARIKAATTKLAERAIQDIGDAAATSAAAEVAEARIDAQVEIEKLMNEHDAQLSKAIKAGIEHSKALAAQHEKDIATLKAKHFEEVTKLREQVKDLQRRLSVVRDHVGKVMA
jgi:2-hydroxychromene-2-carboxylate isomerase